MELIIERMNEITVFYRNLQEFINFLSLNHKFRTCCLKLQTLTNTHNYVIYKIINKCHFALTQVKRPRFCMWTTANAREFG